MSTRLEQDVAKRFETLRAMGALSGFELLRTNPADGQVRYIGIKLGLTTDFDSLDEVERLLARMEGHA